MINSFEIEEENTLLKHSKIRVIQGNNSDLPNQINSACWSGLKSFSEKEKSTTRKTLFIRRNKNGTRDLSVFDSIFVDYLKKEKMYLFKAINKPKVLLDAPSKVHLMSSKREKLDAVKLVVDKGL